MLKGIVCLAAGFAGGFFVGRYIEKRRSDDEYSKGYDEGVKHMKEKLPAATEKIEDSEEEQEDDSEDSEMDEYHQVLKDSGYSSDSEVEISRGGIFVITPEQFYEDRGYNKEHLIYYEDKEQLRYAEYEDADEDAYIIDISGLIGEKALTRFGEYESRTVYVRNMKTRTDYDIVKEDTYEETY